MSASLVILKPDGTRRDFDLPEGTTTVGRKHSCGLRIALSSVSRQHCEVIVAGASVKVRDLGSSNGTFHNGVRVQEATLKPGDELVVGPAVFTVVVDGQPAELLSKRAATAPATQARPLEDFELTDDDPDASGSGGYTPTVELDEPEHDLNELAAQINDQEEGEDILEALRREDDDDR
jgi:pSer/pThr/pTyr-binding forkhead associated (FHA) protein